MDNKNPSPTFASTASKLLHAIKQFARPLTPPILWDYLRRTSGRHPDSSLISYQGVISPSLMTKMHSGTFSAIHEKYASLDHHILCDTNKTRLRVYTLCTFAKIALSNNNSGDFLTAGISYGTAPLIVTEYLNLSEHKRTCYLIDPLNGKGGSNYNTDFELVKNRWNPRVPSVWIREYLSPNVIKDVPPLAFIHLNTGDFDAECSTLPLLFNLLLPGGFIIQDLYGWLPIDQQNIINMMLNKLGADAFGHVTRQLIIFKPARPQL